MNRWKQELVALACWSVPAVLVLLFLVVVSGDGTTGGERANANSVLDLGSKQTSQAVPVPLANVVRAEPNKPRAKPSINPIEASPEPVPALTAARLTELTEQYQRIASDKNVRIRLIPDRLEARTLGDVYMFKLANEKHVLFDQRGQVSELPSSYWVRVSINAVPREVMDHFTTSFAKMTTDQPCLVLSQRVVVQMHRSLYEFVAGLEQTDLQPNCEYTATIQRANSDLRHAWRTNTMSSSDAGLTFSWRMTPQTTSLINRERN